MSACPKSTWEGMWVGHCVADLYVRVVVWRVSCSVYLLNTKGPHTYLVWGVVGVLLHQINPLTSDGVPDCTVLIPYVCLLTKSPFHWLNWFGVLLFFCIYFVWSSALLNLSFSSPSSAEKDKVNPDRKGLAPGRGSLTDPAAPFLNSRKSCSSGSSSSVPTLDISDGSGNNICTTNIPEFSHMDGEPAQQRDCVCSQLN